MAVELGKLPPWNRLIRFVSPSGETLYGEPTDPNLDVGLAVHSNQHFTATVVEARSPWDPKGILTSRIEVVKKLLCPVPAELSGPIRAIGLNYTDHADEVNMPVPIIPVSFLKPPQTFADPCTAIPIPKIVQREELDFEIELAVVLRKDAKDVPVDDALSYVLGYACANDLSARKHQIDTSQWCFSKGFDNFCPLGPCIVSAGAISDPQVIKMRTSVNERVMQDGTTENMIFPVSRLVSYLSQGTTLPKGTTIITGTPAGVGFSQKPMLWLKDGDEVRCFLSHGIGSVISKIQYE